MKTRRDFLKELGAAAFLLPTLPSLFPSRAYAAGKPPLRVMVFFGFNGVHDAAFWPAAAPTTQVAANVYSSKLADIISQKGQVSRVFGTAFNPLANKFSLVRGLGQAVSPYGADNIVHDGASVLALSHIHENSDAYGGEAPLVGSSFDCVIENSTGFYPTKTKMSAVRVVGGEQKWNPSFWRPNGGSTPPYNQVQGVEYLGDNSQNLYKLLLGTAATTTAPASAAYRSKMFDNLLTQFDAISRSPAASSADKERLQAHTQFLSQLRNKVMTGDGGATSGQCAPVTLSTNTRPLDRYTNNLNTIAAAFACDVTRLGVYTFANYDDDGKVTWDADHYNSHEENSALASKGFSTDNVANSAAWTGWQANRVASFMNTLAGMKDVDGSSVLDNTLIIWTNQHGSTHCISNYPTMIGGGAAGQFRMGEYIDFRNTGNANRTGLNDRTLGRPLSNLWMAVMRAVGVPAAEYLKQGEDGAFGQKPGLRAGGNDGYAGGYVGNLATMRRELIPYFYTGPA